ncbi:putative SOS response-associated peptidase YedK [Spinactinospora alkalitolerans]|uniref:Abasic site processing protein n=1 Tax=Spinactinospora alkalitolerans TaxID=687207 RepID=A0A852TP63_9ACTN|nr:SOS response-associated peptidase [Spinactinospora alkalitolerans]NYE45779.1 putative SOS response-associated peptidase YedK [Spinactinospora alkalitolerans]
MCGRYAQGRNRHELQLAFDFPELDESAGGGGGQRSWPPLEELGPDYNVSPGKFVYAVLGPPPGGAGADGPAGPQHLSTLRWGLVPSWAKDPNVGYKMINARSETVAEKPAYRAAFARRRCLLPADAYYEWQLLPEQAPGTAEAGTSPTTDPGHKARKSRARKRPFAVRYADDRPLALAGLFERWRDPERPEEDPDAWLWSCAVITTEAAPRLSHIHERMPVVVPPSHWGTWLDPAADLTDLRFVMDATPVTEFDVYEVDTAVNSIRNNGPELLNPKGEAPEPEAGTLF